jgi:hypothetical protein
LKFSQSDSNTGDQPPATAGGSDFALCGHQERAGHVRRLNDMFRICSVLSLVLLIASGCERQIARTRPPLKPPKQRQKSCLPANSSPKLKLIIDGAIEQVGKTTSYDPSYQSLEYPNGDVPIETGVCSDVIVRAFRKANVDLQKDVHEDMKSNFSAYPTKWGMSGPDSNIDHRRVPNLETYFDRKGKSVKISETAKTFYPATSSRGEWERRTGPHRYGGQCLVQTKAAISDRSQHRRGHTHGRCALHMEDHGSLSILLSSSLRPVRDEMFVVRPTPENF